MSLNESIIVEIQNLAPSSLIELFEVDATALGGEVFRFHNGTNKLTQNITWQGNEYVRFPIQVSGFEYSGQGQFPRPTVSISNALSAMTTILLQYEDLIGAKFTRKRTLLKYLDAVNFPGGVNPTEDDTVYLPDDVFYVDRKAVEDRDVVQFELASAADLQGVRLPKRVIAKSVCPWIYRGPDCNFTGAPLYDINDELLPYPESAEAIAMRDAYADLVAAQDAYTAAQAALVSASNTLTSASNYSAEVRYDFPDLSLNYAAFDPVVGYMRAYWNGVQVSIGTVYATGDYVRPLYVVSGGYSSGSVFKIVKYTRDEAAVTAATTAYNTALSNRDSALAAVGVAQSALDAAIAAVPDDDPVFRQDVCGKRLSSCKIRFGEKNPLNFGGFPGVSK